MFVPDISILNDDYCIKHHIKVISKNYLDYIPIRIINNDIDLVLIDDEAIITDSWSFHAKQKGLRLMTFNCIDDMLAKIDFISDANFP